ncbi:ABC transporter substrate-binding protein [Leekyejoonella antrihumi]|uniref:ABC transporter substrate-binding protein n=1 Tax=Leekyejoonella antrihumi TaxID=1660198 RepID=UPI001647D4EE|nr:ABC transporter substrate-binding protein [Leekyejoonella antrihumi]
MVAPPTLDLTSNPAAAIDEVFDYNVYQHLVQLDPKGDVVPVLASKYSVSKDGKTYTFDVRKGVKFANGDPMTPQDVVFSLKRVIAPKSNYPYKDLFSDITGVRASGNQVTVTLSESNNQFLYDMAAYSNGVILDPKTVGQIAKKPNGTGPYEFGAFVANYSVTLHRNNSYWDGKPGVATVVFRYFSNTNAAGSALKSGQVQAIDNLAAGNPSEASQFKGNPAYKIISGPTNGKIQMSINNTRGPLAKVKVRQAIIYATNRRAILETVGAGYGTVIGTDTVPPDPWYSTSYANTYPYNPGKAKQLLAQAGYPNGFSVTLTLPPYGYATTAGPLLVAELKAVGINATIKNVQWPLWLSQVFTNTNYDLTIINHVEARDLANYTNPTYYWKYAKTSQVNSMLAKANSETSSSAELAGYQKILTTITSDAVNDWLYNPDQITVANKNVVGLPGSGITESFDLSHVSLGGQLPANLAAQGYAK